MLSIPTSLPKFRVWKSAYSLLPSAQSGLIAIFGYWLRNFTDSRNEIPWPEEPRLRVLQEEMHRGALSSPM
uniref:Uncharacterized protein n=1 Tax=Physcomitrium patens TaxID=3218 RepID=A0A2K1ISK2_PHYPA|nr:hypothetical protein PHYPA_026383 [Physcomitrium patens]